MTCHSFVPKNMLKGTIVPTMKSNRVCQTDSANYRPVMNSSMFLKVFEYCILPNLQKSLPLNDTQFGFKTGSSCCHAITLLKEVILKYNGDRTPIHCTSIDLSKAFDRVNFDILVKKLRETALSQDLIILIEYMMKNTFVQVNYSGYKADEFKILSGVRQGGILSATLFNFYLHTVMNRITSMNAGCTFQYERVNLIAYADDLILLAPSATGLQLLLDELNSQLEAMDLLINFEKSSYIVFRGKRRLKFQPVVFLSGKTLKKVNSLRYLGVVLTDDLSLDLDIERAMNSFLTQFYSMYNRFYFVDKNTLYFLFKNFTTSFYGVNLWFDYKLSEKSLSKISVSFHRAVKRIAGMNIWNSNHVACEKVGINVFRHLMNKRMLKHLCSLLCSEVSFFKRHRLFFWSSSNIKRTLDRVFIEKYSIPFFLRSDFDALLARIDFVERNEPRSNYSPDNFVQL